LRISAEIVVDGNITPEEARLKWEQTAVSSSRKVKIKGKSLFLHLKKDGKYVLQYYQNYGSDVCDAVFIGDIYEYDENGSQITGKVKAPRSMKILSIILFVLALPIAVLINTLLYYVLPTLSQPKMADDMIYMGDAVLELLTIAGSGLVIIVIGVMCLIVDKRKVSAIIDYLYNFLRRDNREDINNG
jgi:uncharacterized protein YjeT (DUF2065 family)